VKLTWKTQLIALLIIVGINIYSCTQSSYSPEESLTGEDTALADGTMFDRTSLLESFGACIIDEIETFQEQSQAFSVAAKAAVSDPSQYDVAREAWQNTIDTWQQLEVMHIGPAGRKTQPGGLGLRDSIYAWPLDDYCQIDRYLVSEAYDTDTDAVEFNANGLWAAEYLLFNRDGTNDCGSDDEINADGTWNMIDESTLNARRIRYAAFTADTVAKAASALLNEWSPTGENFLAELTQAGNSSRTYGKKRVAINAVSDALSYIEWATKDNKLARPLGIIGCEEDFCIDLVESKYARRSKEHLRNNMLGFRKLFKGCGVDNTGLGFDDFLYAVGQNDLAEKMDQAALAAINAIDAIDEVDLVSALEEDIQSVLEVHRRVDELTDLLRSDFLTVLNLQLPQMVQGDND
jgi:predicted lipoprotein